MEENQMNSNEKYSIGEKMVNAIINDRLIKDSLPNHGKPFHGGYEQLYLYKFKTYLGSVSRAIINQNIIGEQFNEY